MFKEIFEPKKTLKLFGLSQKFIFLKNLLIENRFPKVLMFTGLKGIGKFTLINHLMNFYYDKKNYDLKEFKINEKNIFYQQFLNNIYPNVYYLNAFDLKAVKIEDIRSLKNYLNKTPINNDKRFIILDDVETLNINSLNALLRLIEEPSDSNFFILINNKSRKILDTIKSRCLEIKIILNDNETNKITSSLIDYFKQNITIKNNGIKASPGNYIKFNYFLDDKKINIEDEYIINVNKILNCYKKEKNIFYKEVLFFLTEHYLQFKTKNLPIHKVIDKRSFICKEINDFFIYNLNQGALLNSIENKYINE